MPPIALRRRWLTRTFATVGAAIMVLSAVALASIIRQVSTNQLHEVAQQESAALGRAAANRIWPELLDIYRQPERPSPVPKGGSRLAPITGPVSTFLTEAGIISITLYTPSGQLLFTTRPSSQIPDPSQQHRIANAASGLVDSRIGFYERMETANGILLDRWLVSTFAPFRAGDGSPIDAVVEVVGDTTELHEMAAAAEAQLLAIIIVAFALVFSLLLAIVWSANVRSDAQHAGHLERVSREAKADSMALIGTLMEAWPDYVYVKDTESRFILANPATATVMGASKAAELIGKSDFDFFPRKLAEDFYNSEQEMLATGRSVIGRLEHIVQPDGSTTWFSTTKMPYRDANGNVLGFIGIGRNVTKEREASTDLRQAKEDAEYANRTKSEFLATMSHELRTPLNAIIGFSEIIKSEAFGPAGNPTYKEYAKDINESGAHLLELINDILDLSKVEAGSMELSESDVSLNDVVPAVHVLVKERAQQAQVGLEFPMAPNLPTLRADERKLKQILVNLLSNAIKFTEAGGQVSLSVENSQAGVVLKVTDTGIGIPAHAIGKALEPFGQVDNQLSRRFEGSGLGLPLAKSFTELHGGKLLIKSEVNHGTTVSVRLPAARTVGATGTA